jgi:hypothetical protein
MELKTQNVGIDRPSKSSPRGGIDMFRKAGPISTGGRLVEALMMFSGDDSFNDFSASSDQSISTTYAIEICRIFDDSLDSY